MTEHTPTPWKAEEGYAGSGPFDRLTIGNSEVVVGVINRLIPAGPANAAFIIKAVNCHEILVRALTDALCELSACAEQMGCRQGGSVHRAQEAARLTLSDVGGKQLP